MTECCFVCGITEEDGARLGEVEVCPGWGRNVCDECLPVRTDLLARWGVLKCMICGEVLAEETAFASQTYGRYGDWHLSEGGWSHCCKAHHPVKLVKADEGDRRNLAERHADDMLQQVVEGVPDRAGAYTCERCGVAGNLKRFTTPGDPDWRWRCSDEDACTERRTAEASPGAVRAQRRRRGLRGQIALRATVWSENQNTANEERLLDAIGEYTDFINDRRTVSGS